MSTFQPAEETLLEQGEDRETNTHEDGTSQKMACALLVLITVNYLARNGNLSGTKHVRLLASPEIQLQARFTEVWVAVRRNYVLKKHNLEDKLDSCLPVPRSPLYAQWIRPAWVSHLCDRITR